jgi:hypothetical protein
VSIGRWRESTTEPHGRVVVWDVQKNKQFGQALAHAEAVTASAFSPDGRMLVTACENDQAQVWMLATSKVVAVMGHRGDVTSVAFHPQGTLVATASDDRTARIWDITHLAQDSSVQPPKAKAVGQPLRHQRPVTQVSFSQDGSLVLTASEDGSARLWDAETGEAVTNELKRQWPIRAAAFVHSPPLAGAQPLIVRTLTHGPEPLIREMIREKQLGRQTTFPPSGFDVATLEDETFEPLSDNQGKNIKNLVVLLTGIQRDDAYGLARFTLKSQAAQQLLDKWPELKRSFVGNLSANFDEGETKRWHQYQAGRLLHPYQVNRLMEEIASSKSEQLDPAIWHGVSDLLDPAIWHSVRAEIDKKQTAKLYLIRAVHTKAEAIKGGLEAESRWAQVIEDLNAAVDSDNDNEQLYGERGKTYERWSQTARTNVESRERLNDRAGLCSCSLSSSDHAPCRIGLAVSLA